ncbi:MAG TPA: hypothetical protein VGE51_11110 [Fontimonas sp.]
MLIALLAGPLPAAPASVDVGLDAELRAFLQRAVQAAPRTPRSFSAQLADVPSADHRRVASPQIELTAGRIDSHHCLYQLRLKVRWTGRLPAGASPAEDGRVVLRQIECGELAREVPTIALREIAALRQQLRGRGLRMTSPSKAAAALDSDINRDSAGNREVDADAAATPPAASAAPSAVTPMRAQVGQRRLNLRLRPAVTAPLMQRIAPGTELQLLPSGEPGWYALADRAGFVSASGVVFPARAAHPAADLR